MYYTTPGCLIVMYDITDFLPSISTPSISSVFTKLNTRESWQKPVEIRAGFAFNRCVVMMMIQAFSSGVPIDLCLLHIQGFPRLCQRAKSSLEIVVVILRKGLRSSILKLLFILVLELVIKLEFWRLQCWSLHEVKGVVTGELSSQPQERLLEVVVRLGRNIVVLQVLLAMKGDLLSLHLAILDFYFVPAQYNGNVLTNSGQITMPVGNILVCDARSDVKHDNCTLSLNVVSITKSAKFLLSGSIPYVEFDRTTVGVKCQRVHLNPQSCYVFLFKLSGQVALDKSGLTNPTISYKDEFEFWCLSHDYYCTLYCEQWR
mmetsp:Transcript_29224/g.79085  ORF Transcript_29224/g.79085 Transcript_29224/m.79085 type:complete len:317 (+) Transcript_29224:1253-2203(+)